jgi:hypothetical protein
MAALSARSAYAQPPPPPDPSTPVRVLTQRPYRGLFGGGTGQMSQSLTLGLSMGGGLDSSVFIDNRGDPNAVVPMTRRHSGFLQGSANLDYMLNLEPVSFAAGGGVAGAYYPVLDRPVARRYFADARGAWRISPKASLAGGYWMSFLPVTHLLPLPVGNDPSFGPDDPFENTTGAQAESYRTSTASVGFNYDISRRVNTSVRYSNWRSKSPDRDHDVSTDSAAARISYSLTQTVGIYGGYHVDSGVFHPNDPTGDSVRYSSQGFDFGIDFAKALSLTRKTTAAFGVGMTGISDGQQTQYGVTGNASIQHEIARTWHVGAAYTRNVSFAQAFTEPVFTDWLNANLYGLISRRLRFHAQVGTSFGAVGLSYTRTEDENYRALFASAGLGYAISRHLNAGARYWYTRHQFDRGLDVPADLRSQTGRHGVSGYLSAWIPIFSRTRRP